MVGTPHTARCYETVLDAIGRTPLIRLKRFAENAPCKVFGKVEFFNPGGSVKDRVALAMVTKAEAEGRIKPGYRRSSRQPRATPVSAWRWSPPSAAIAASLSCPTR